MASEVTIEEQPQPQPQALAVNKRKQASEDAEDAVLKNIGKQQRQARDDKGDDIVYIRTETKATKRQKIIEEATAQSIIDIDEDEGSSSSRKARACAESTASSSRCGASLAGQQSNNGFSSVSSNDRPSTSSFSSSPTRSRTPTHVAALLRDSHSSTSSNPSRSRSMIEIRRARHNGRPAVFQRLTPPPGDGPIHVHWSSAQQRGVVCSCEGSSCTCTYASLFGDDGAAGGGGLAGRFGR